MKDTQALTQKLEGEKYLAGKVYNNLLVCGNQILAFEHDSSSFAMINRNRKSSEQINWPQ